MGGSPKRRIAGETYKTWKKLKKLVDKQKERWYYKPRCWGNALKQRLSRRSLKRLPVRQQKRKIKKVEKSSWQTANNMIWYQSCSGEEITKINKRTLITEQWNNLEKFLKVLFFKELTFKNSKKGCSPIGDWRDEIAKQLFWPNQTHFIREFDPGSGWTLAACLTHASRTRNFKWDFGGFWNS